MYRAPIFAVVALALAFSAVPAPSQVATAAVNDPVRPNRGCFDDWSGCFQRAESSWAPTFIKNVNLAIAKAITWGSPLLIDLDNDGKIGITNLDDDPESFFDIDEDGFAEQIAWIGPDDGLLARDLNGNGRIDDANELFGSTEEDGFTQLARLDANDDGVVDQSDPDFATLLVWRDIDGDGISAPEELHALSAFSISALHVEALEVNQANAGNRVSHIGAFVVTENGRDQRRAVHDVWFRYSNMNTRYSRDYDLDDRVTSLPDLRGYGVLPNLGIAMSLDREGAADLLDQVDRLAALNFEAVFEKDGRATELVRQILFAWAEVDDLTPDSRGRFVDAREITFLERLTDQEYRQREVHPNPFTRAGEFLSDIFEYVYDRYNARLLAQVIGEDLFRFEDGYTLRPGATPGLQSAYDLATDDFPGIVGLKPSGIEALEVIATEAGDPDYVWDIVLQVIEFSVGLNALPVEDLTLLSQSLEVSGASPLAARTSALQANRQGLGGAVERRERRTQLTDFDRDGYLVGTDGNDILVGDNGDEVFDGGDGDDEIRGMAGDDHLSGQGGSDYLLGSLGNDVYFFELGDGIDVINDGIDNKGRDILRFGAGIALSDLIFESRGNKDLMITLRDNPSDAVLIENQFNGPSRLEVLRFADGSEDSLVDRRYALIGTAQADKLTGIAIGGSPDDIISGLAGNDTINGGLGNDELDGGDGDDRILGGRGDDVLVGGPGNDALRGGAGNDVLDGGPGDDILDAGLGDDLFFYESGDDRFVDSRGLDRLVIENTRSTDVSYLRVGNDLKIVLRDGGSLLLVKHFSGARIETLDYIDADVKSSSVEFTSQGGDGNDRLRGSPGDDILIGGGGDDRLGSGDGNDSLDGGHGNDVLDSGKGDDVLKPGHGDDVAKGGSGNDRFTYASGHDRYADRAGDYDVVVLSAHYRPEQVTLLRRVDDLRDLKLEINQANSVTLIGHFTTNDAFEEIVFEATGDTIDLKTLRPTTMGSAGDDVLHGVKRGANLEDKLFGLAGNDRILAGNGDDWLAGGAGNDRLEGGAGADVYFYAIGDGDDIIVDTGGNDVIRFDEGIVSEDLVFTEEERDLIIGLPAHGNSRLILMGHLGKATKQIESLEFADGSIEYLVNPN